MPRKFAISRRLTFNVPPFAFPRFALWWWSLAAKSSVLNATSQAFFSENAMSLAKACRCEGRALHILGGGEAAWGNGSLGHDCRRACRQRWVR